MHDAFLADIAANSDDDAPRLVYADWLDEHGDPERAQFIRAQCRLATMGPCDPERFGLELDQEALLERHVRKWLRPLPKIGARVEFARGFPHRLTLSAAKFVSQGEALLAAAPTLREYRPLLPRAAWDELLKCPTLGRFTTLDVGYAKVGVAGIQSLVAAPLVAGLRSLNVSGSALRRKGSEALAASPYLANLRRLDLRRNDLRDGGAEVFAASPNFPALEALDVRANGLGPAAVAALARSPLAPRLRELALGEDRSGDDLAAAFASGEWRSLRKLFLGLERTTDAGMAALAACPSLAGLRELELKHGHGEPCPALFASPHLAGLERLALRAFAGPGSLEALADSPMLANLRGLLATSDGAGLKAVLASPASAGLVELQLQDFGEGLATVARRFAEAGHLTNLRKLSLGDSHRPPTWVPDVVGSAHLAGVVDLHLDASLDERGLEALVASPYLGRVRRLRLYHFTFRKHPKWRAAVEERFGPGVLTTK
jgi:uncharacterized protein (TIGR02996 family)